MQKGDFIQTDLNGEAGYIVRRVRLGLSERRRRVVSQVEFGAMLGEQLGTAPVAQSTVSEWEGGRGTVPGSVVLAALKLYGTRLGRDALDALLAQSKLSYVHALAA